MKMENTSMGFHTFSIFLKMRNDEFNCVTGDFIRYANENINVKRFPLEGENGKNIGWCYTDEKEKGILWHLLSFSTTNGFCTHGIRAIINPKVILEKNYIRAALEDDLVTIEKIFNEKIKKISSSLYEMKYWSLSRVDYCLNIDLKELGFPCSPEQMMMLIKRGNIPGGFKELEYYDKNAHRKKTHKENFYLKSKYTTINFYWKYDAQDENHPNYDKRELSHDVIRLEVQCKYHKLYNLSNKYHTPSNKFSDEEISDMLFDNMSIPSISIYNMLSSFVSDNIVCDYIQRILLKGNYYIFETAIDIVKSKHFRKEKEERLLDTLILVNKKGGISKAKAGLEKSDLNRFERSINDLDNIYVNPVTIPRRWGIKCILNPLRVFCTVANKKGVILEPHYLFLFGKEIEHYQTHYKSSIITS